MQNVLEEIVSALGVRNTDGTYNKLKDQTKESQYLENEISEMIEKNGGNGPVPTNIDELLKTAVIANASDVHISAGTFPKYRVSGELMPMKKLGESAEYGILKPSDIIKLFTPILTEEQLTILADDGDLDFAYQAKDVGRFRCNFYKQRGSWAGVFRMLATNIPTPEDLNLPEAVVNLTNRKRGLVLVTGPTGSGKSTTLAALIHHINTHSKRNIITLEDPIEFVHKHGLSNVNQREIGADTKSFASALRAALREDPDVILVGEMRDFETISTAIRAAETGHLVFSTLHTLGAADTINRIIDTYPEEQQSQARAQIAGSLEGVISQQLIPKRIGGGRVAALEIMLGNTAIRNNIRENHIEQISSSIQSGHGEGMILLDESLRKLVDDNIVEADVAIEFAKNPKTFFSSNASRMLSSANNPFGRR